MFFLDVDPQESLRRIQMRSEQEMFENLQELHHVRVKALNLVQKWHIIDGNHTINETHQQITDILDVLDST
jgi:dTMP kinase